jgi:endonuclease/exonuclease/phosphatase family metal-dependent hydrolase
MHMKNFLAMFLLAAAMASLVTISGCAPKQRELTVMTYNIHHGAGMDKKLDLERIARVIRAQKPDLVALQEVDDGTKRTNYVMQAEELARLTKMHQAYGAAMDFDGGKYGDAVLSRYKIAESRVISLGYTPGDRREPRVAVATIVALPGGGEIAFISTHLDHTAASPDRLEQAKAINEQVRNVNQSAVLAGDFNCEVGSEPMAELEKVWKVVSNGDGSLTCPADEPRTKIDHVLVKPLGRWRVVDAKVIDERVASDHRPVVVRLVQVD